MIRKRVVKQSKKAARAERNHPTQHVFEPSNVEKAVSAKKVIEVSSVLTVREFAEVLKVPVTDVISKLVHSGVMATINESIDLDTMAIIGDELGYDVQPLKKEEKVQEMRSIEKNLVLRPPVVTVMGHVDHGKTKLLDTIRSTDIVATESGGITQHIGAYQVTVLDGDGKERVTTFLDTPGHEAFSAMRAHGANITDVVILVVAANDGVKPQTVEAAAHAKEAGVPVIVALNKIDLPDSDIDRVKRQLADIGLLPEEWGGDTQIVNVSAKTGENIKELLNTVLLVADLKEPKADPNLLASGVVIEAHMQAGRGPIATILVQEGTLRVGDPFIIGQTYGKVRIMENYLGKKVQVATPSTPVRIAGLQDLPNFGDRFLVVENEKVAKELVKTKTIKRRVLSIGEISQDIKDGKIKELKLVLKADVAGSLEAINTSLKNISTEEVKINVINEGVGDVTESDINMAVASGAIVIGFRVKSNGDVMNLAKREHIKIQIYDIIYQLLDDLHLALSGMLEPEIIETEVGRMKVLAIFKVKRNIQIIGGKVTTGKIENGCEVNIVRNKETIATGKITNLQQDKRDVKQVYENFECGLVVDSTMRILVDDSLECYKKEERVRRLA